MAEQLAAAHAQNKHLRAALEERDHTISQLRRENKELSETVALQAETLREQEAALTRTVRVPATCFVGREGRVSVASRRTLQQAGRGAVAALSGSRGYAEGGRGGVA